MKRFGLFSALLFPFLGYAVYSYALLDPNLVLTQNSLYWQFQRSMWSIGFEQLGLSTGLFITLLIGMLLVWRWFAQQSNVQRKKNILISILCIFLLAYPALSHDLFNYMFNAKIVVVYHQNPHVRSATDFPQDLWTRFMHNVQTPAPYGEGWTLFSLPPFLLGFSKFITTYLAFKVWMVLGYLGWIWSIGRLKEVLSKMHFRFADWDTRLWILISCPLVLIEMIATSHNDLWMMGLTVLGMSLVLEAVRTKRWLKLIGGLVVFGLGVWMKFVPVVLIPITILLVLHLLMNKSKFISKIAQYWAEIAVVCCVIPLLTARSQYFHPWYLTWALTFFPFVRLRIVRITLIAFSISSLFRYVPYLLAGDFTPQVITQQLLITWLGGIVLTVVFLIYSSKMSSHARMNT